MFWRRIPLSTRRYAAAGRVERATIRHVSDVERSVASKRLYERPANIAPLSKVPCSASNLSSRGISARVLNNAWRKFRCMRGYVFNRYTVRDKRVRYQKMDGPHVRGKADTGRNLLVPRLTSFGIRAPHCTTFQTFCNSNIQKTITKSSTVRVNRGKRKT